MSFVKAVYLGLKLIDHKTAGFFLDLPRIVATRPDGAPWAIVEDPSILPILSQPSAPFRQARPHSDPYSGYSGALQPPYPRILPIRPPSSADSWLFRTAHGPIGVPVYQSPSSYRVSLYPRFSRDHPRGRSAETDRLCP